MSNTLQRISNLVEQRRFKVSDHGYNEMAEDNILIKDIVGGLQDAVVVEDYPDFAKGPCVLVLQHDGERNPIHVLWGTWHDTSGPAVLITAYRPDPAIWTDDFERRR